MNTKWNHVLAAAVLGLGLVAGTYAPAYAAPAWSLPAQGVKLDNAAKQAYVAKTMDAMFHPAKDAVPAAFTAPDGWSYTTVTEKGLKLEKLENPQGSADRTVLQLHGGGYIVPLHNGYKNLAVRQAVLSQAKATYMVNYRLAPQNKYPAALDDALTAYQYILNQGTPAKQIIVFGDSAGGNLALALALKLKEENLPQPGLYVLDSPWTTLETKSPSRQGNVKKDLVLGETNKVMFHEINHPTYAPAGMKLSDVRLSPLHGDLTGLPPMLIQTGSYELFLDDATKLAEKAANDGVKVTLTVYPAMSHDFALCIPDLQDSIDSYAEIKDFINLNMEK